MADIEQRARELLAAEYRKAGKTDWAESIAANDYAESEHYALLAISAALASQAQVPEDVLRDAERYRLIRNCTVDGWVESAILHHARYAEVKMGEQLDAAIDAAIAAAPAPEVR
ncbi:hypothetical protein NG831_06310 [Xanthomonas sacchari]|uniref:hypothetical protein n=1 Tax=Xanthomonas sacchari TaxID=56458 RepID=UPI00224E6E9D|nr:hypothetical protein [Xanthomonas sacchari]MCW0413523.1 hypothetical protein [Xanthomonas sacchari]UYK67772.1 hypothetical protein NG831_06310 [Xanthomonas sacchari]